VETVRSGTEWYAVDDASAVGAARREAVRLAEKLGFDEQRSGDVGIVVTELAGNLLKHASDGTIGIQVALRDGTAGVQLIATDRGPGMSDLDLSALDGHSTTGTLGVGLGAAIRLSSSVDISTKPGSGTVLCAELWPDAASAPAAGDIDIAGLTRPITGEQLCGDAIGARTLDGHHLMMVSDGLGHGPMAANASAEALTAFHGATNADPGAVLHAIHERLRGTRGAAVCVAALDAGYRSVGFAGTGNISAYVADGEQRRGSMSQPGIVGHQLPRLRVIDLPLSDDALVVMHSDGLRESWNLARTPGLTRRSAAVVAGTLLRDAGSRPDDASVLVARRRR
jgi:anti-sigma regulatory factor (Ser/Thr protein kinase)